MAITRAQQYRQMLREGSVAIQGGIKNYLGEQKTISDVPIKWKSGPGHPETELAYITKAEKNLLIKKDLHKSLKDGPNKGPGGIISLNNDGIGDLGGPGNVGGTGGQTDTGDLGSEKANDANLSAGNKGVGYGGRDGDPRTGGGVTTGGFLDKAKDYITGGGLIGMAARGLRSLFSGPKAKDLGIRGGYNMANIAGPVTTEEDDDKGGGDGIVPYWAQLGYPSEQAYLASLQAPAGLPAAVQPQQTMDLNKIAYRLMADGGFLGEEDETRQAYGLGSIVKKITRPIKKVVKKATSAVKKVAKSPLGRLALAVAAPYALGPAMAQSQFLMGLSAAQRAALISGATTGITQLASGEDLDLKDIALSAALSGGVSKFTAPKGIDGKAFNASRASQPSKFQMPRGGGADLSKIAASNTRPNMFDIAGPVRGGSGIVEAASKAAKDPSIFSKIGEGLKNIKGSKVLQFAKDNPTLSILGASGLAGIMAKKDFEEDEFSEIDRGEGIDIAAIRRRPFDYMAPRFAGSEFDFYAADGGRIGYSNGTDLSKNVNYKGWVKMYKKNPEAASMNENHSQYLNFYERNKTKKAKGSKEPVAKKVMPLLDMNGQEMDLRAEGGFVPIGRMEKADDVPARLSKNEFVFTADAVRNAGEGNVDKGAEVMYNMMKNLESGGDVSKESQGLDGARKMFQTSQRLEEVL